jgi:hypothetical protein
LIGQKKIAIYRKSASNVRAQAPLSYGDSMAISAVVPPQRGNAPRGHRLEEIQQSVFDKSMPSRAG